MSVELQKAATVTVRYVVSLLFTYCLLTVYLLCVGGVNIMRIKSNRVLAESKP